MDRCQAFALLPWQGTYDFYRDRTRLDGIYSSGFLKGWWNQSVLRNQHGNPATNCISIYTGERVTGPASHRPHRWLHRHLERREDENITIGMMVMMIMAP